MEIIKALRSDDIELAKLLIENGSDLNEKDYNGNTPLLCSCCCCYDNYEIIKLLIEKGSDVNAKDKFGNTPLGYARYNNNRVDLVKFLIENGEHINEKDNLGYTPLEYACIVDNNYEIVRLLIERGAKISDIDLILKFNRKNDLIDTFSFDQLGEFRTKDTYINTRFNEYIKSQLSRL